MDHMRQSLARTGFLIFAGIAWGAPAAAQVYEVIISIDGMT